MSELLAFVAATLMAIQNLRQPLLANMKIIIIYEIDGAPGLERVAMDGMYSSREGRR